MKIFKNTLVILGLLSLQGCSEDVLTQTPDHVISENLVLNSVEKLDKLLIGTYNEISRNTYLGRVLYKRAAVKGTDFRFVKTTFNPRDYESIAYKYEESANNSGSCADLWRQSYKAINNLNLIINNIEAAEGSEAAKREILGEAHGLRGMVFFDLARTFAYPWIRAGASSQGLPLKLSSEEVVVDRSSLGETYDQVLLDLQKAHDLLGENTWEQGSTKYLTKMGVKALMARVYLYKQDWGNALKYAAEVIDARGAANLLQKDSYVFENYNSESLFELSITAQNSLGSNGLGAQFDVSDGGQGDVIATKTFTDLLGAYENDPRALLLQEDKEGTQQAFIKYFNQGDGGGLSAHNIPIIRLSEMYLIAAEAAAHGAGGGETAALTFLNTLIENRTTNFAAHKATETGEALKERIAEERRRELALEGHGVYDYIRRGKDISRPGDEHVNTGVNAANLNIQATDNRTICPIPASEVEASGMEQTEGY
ncbi:RagB/SusD family nutrient uptake outer membrane protein [Antarcticibacterium arcticum]|uniref:RagB/SusD family nutrient uptake outer membrane protein n=1 Tax=Antarcticibacterium arcticum TaxID=2585771 RepID=A0A5B8YM54_9FLAO|nr:RagB/SusD family nutrient uptake outer membrane protein [Antarcticibacterium arcticum]QED39002.1 RagB/SusD family nutrient uptake outer membrane protein [Antarcticibacterium arcticum]